MNAKAEFPSRTRTMIVEDQGMVRAFFERWLAGLPMFMLVASARSGEEALAQVEATRPDVVLVVSTLVDPLALTRIRESGVEGYVEKDATPELLAEALEAVAEGRQYYSSRFREIMASEGANAESVGKILSRREQQVLGLVLGRKNNREIADQMGLSVRTVEFHRANMMAKLDAKNLTELVTRAKHRGLGG